MLNFNTAKLRVRIFWGYSIPILLSIGAATFVFINTNIVRERARTLQTSNQTTLDLKSIEVEFFRMQKAARGYFLGSLISKEANDEFFNEYEEAVRDFDGFNEEIIQKKDDQDKQKVLIEMGKIKNRIDDNYRIAFKLFDEGKPQEGLAHWRSKVVDDLKVVETLNNQLQEIEQQNLNQATKEQTAALESLTLVVIISTAIAALLAIGIALWLTSTIAQKMNEAASEIATSSSEIATTVAEQERIASQQATAVNQTTTTMDELGASSTQAATQAEAVASRSRLALTITEQGNQTVQATLAGMIALKKKVEALAEQINCLNEQTGQIGGISQIVTDLANQTNMLALNAAVEAIRAGEHGKSFGIVAGEIRQLAEQSKLSANKINSIVSDIQSAINSTVKLTDESTETVKEGMRLTEGTARAFSGVAEAIGEVVVSGQQISLSAQQQALAVQQVVDVMNALNQGAIQTVTGITQTKFGTQQLHQSAQNLKSMV